VITTRGQAGSQAKEKQAKSAPNQQVRASLNEIQANPRSPNQVRASLNEVQANPRCSEILEQAARVGRRGVSHAVMEREMLLSIEPMDDATFLGAWMLPGGVPGGTGELLRRQELLQRLNETRFDALQRLVAFFVLFHAMAKGVADFWPLVSAGLLGYDISRSQSMLRVASTASPVPGMEVRDRMVQIGILTRRIEAVSTIQRIWRNVRLMRWVDSNRRMP
jgi:hypothetical protein